MAQMQSFCNPRNNLVLSSPLCAILLWLRQPTGKGQKIMNATLWKQALLAGGLLTAGLTAQPEPLQRSDVAAEPAWLVHVDCDRLRPTVVGQYLMAELDKPEAQARLGAFQAIFNFDPRKQLHGLTLYSPSED